MKKTILTTKSALKLNREHIRLLTPTQLTEAVGGAPTTKPTASNQCETNSTLETNTCQLRG